MATTRPASNSARFGDFDVNLGTGQLNKSGVHIPLQDQPFQILRLLLEAAPELVTREQIGSALWPSDTFVDFELGTNTAIRKLRHALDDSVENPKYIQTLAKRGYRFIAPIEWIAKPLPSKPAPPSSDGPVLVTNRGRSSHKGIRSRILRVAGLIVSALLVVVAIVRLAIPGRSKEELTAVPLTTVQGDAVLPSFSPDGEQTLFVWDKKNGHPAEIFIQSVHDSAEAVQLTHLEDSMGIGLPPVWSPDGRWIAYGRFNPKWSERPLEIVLIPAPMGGHEMVVDRLGDCCDGLSWSPDSKFLVYGDKERSQDAVSIFMLDRDTLQRRRLTTPPKGTSQFLGDVNPVFNGDGTRLAFWRMLIVGVNEVLVLNMHTGALQTIVHESSSPPELGALAWDVSGKSLIYVSDRSGISHLWRVDENGGNPEALMVGEDASSVAFSDRGHRLAFTKSIRDSNIWKISIDPSGTERRSPLIASSRLDHQAMYSPDGTKVVFNSDRSGFEEIWMTKSDGSDAVQLTHLNTHATGSPMWSPDSQRIAFDARTAGQGDIYVVGLDGGGPKRITSGDFDNAVPVWSADGKWIYYTTNRLGEQQIFRVPVDGGAPLQVTLHGGNWPLNVDDQRMYYLKVESSGEVWRKSFLDGEESRVPGVPEIPSLMIVQVRDEGVYFTSDSYSGHLRFFDFSTKQVRELSQLGPALDRGISISKDGRSILYSQKDSDSSNIMLVENFH